MGQSPSSILLGSVNEPLRALTEKLQRDRAMADRILARKAASEVKPDAKAAAIRLDGDKTLELAQRFGTGLRPRRQGAFHRLLEEGRAWLVDPIGPGRARHGNLLLVDKGQTGATTRADADRIRVRLRRERIHHATL